MTAKNKKSFLVHIDSLSVLEDLTDEQAGQLLKAISAYQKGEEIELNPIVKIAFSPFKNQFMRDNEKYEKMCEIRAKAGAMGGRAKSEKEKQDLANASKSKQDLAKLAENKNKTNNKSDSNSEDISNLPTVGKPPSKRFTPPTQKEVYDYMGEYAQGKGEIISEQEPEKFVNFYSAKNWYVGKTKMKDWKASARNWVLKAIEKQSTQPKQSQWGNNEALAKQFDSMLDNGEFNQ